MKSAPPLPVALDATAVPAELTGAGVYVYELARALAARGDVDLALVVRRGDTARWLELGAASVLPLAPDRLSARLAFGELGLGAALRRRADAVVLHGPHYTMPRRARVPVVVTVHDLTLIEHPEWHERTKVAYFARAIRRSAREAAGIVCVSKKTAARLSELCPPKGTVAVIEHGIDHARFTPKEPGAGADVAVLEGLGVSSPYLLHVGTAEPRKNLPLLVAAFERLSVEHRGLTLVLAGSPGWGSEPLERAIAASGARERILRLGYVEAGALPALLRRAAAVVYPSIEEGFGLPALEALACGAALVTTAGSVMADLAGPAAFTAPVGDSEALAGAIREALVGGPSRRQLGLARAATFTWEASAAAHLELYREVAGRARGRSRRADPH